MVFLSFSISGQVIQIDSIEKLQKIGNDPDYPLDGEYELTQDIDASDTIHWNNGAGFMPIGNGDNKFRGKFFGKGHKITRLYINRPELKEVGLFGGVYDGEIINLKLEDVWIFGQKTGGLVGTNWGVVDGCSVNGTVIGEWSIGGLIGRNGGIVNNCYAVGTVIGTYYVGGLVGWNAGGWDKNRNKIRGCYFSGSVAGLWYVGGLLSWNERIVENSYFVGTVFGGGAVGGLIAYNKGGIVSNCYATGVVTGTDYQVGGLIGQNEGTVNNAYWDTQAEQQDGVGAHISGESFFVSINNTLKGKKYTSGSEKTTAEMKQKATYIGWNFDNTWSIEEGVSYPYLKSLGPAQEVKISRVEKNIKNLEELNKIGRDWDYPWTGVYHLEADIDASSTKEWFDGKGFKSIMPFAGKFYGHGHVVQHLHINRHDESLVGLLGCMFIGAEVREIGLLNVNILGKDTVGGLVGGNWGGTVDSCYAIGSVSGEDDVGGLIGEINDGLVSNSYSMGSVSGSGNSVGGLAGGNYKSKIDACYSTSFINGSRDSGGLVGSNRFGEVTRSYWDIVTSGRSNSYGWKYISRAISFVRDTPLRGSSAGGVGKSTADMKRQATYVGWDFSTIWGIKEGQSYPYLLWQKGPVQECK